jgi:hydrogenase maturation protease
VRTLVIGYGNIDRCDDGIGYFVINGLRQRLGYPLLSTDESGLDRLGHPVDAVFIRQLVPEMLPDACDYDQLVFVDAAAHEQEQTVVCRPIDPVAQSAALTHQLSPPAFLRLLRVLYEKKPAGFLVAVPGFCFDFQHGLSAAAANEIDAAVAWIESLVKHDDPDIH